MGHVRAFFVASFVASFEQDGEPLEVLSQRSLQSKKNNDSGQSPGPLSPVTSESQLIMLRMNI